MNSIRYSRLVAGCFVVLLALSAAAPVAAVSVTEDDVSSEAEVGSTFEASATLGDLYTDNEQWRVNATTELVNDPKWTLELIDDGEVVETKTRVGQNVTFSDADVQSPVDEIRVSVEGEVPEVPEVGEYTYSAKETFEAMSIAQVPVTSDGATGAPSTIETYDVHHYTTESKEARQAIDSAAAAIADADDAGADVSDAEGALENAKAFYNNSDFDQATKNAEDAEKLAGEAKSQKQSSEQTTQLLIYAAVGVVVLALVGGGVYWYKQNQQDTSRLG